MSFTFRHTKYTCYFSYITSAVINNLPALLFATFQRNFGISTVMLAHLIAINFGTQIFVDFFGARYAEKLGYRKCAIAANIFAIIGFWSYSLLPYILPSAYAGLVAASMISAVGSGLFEVIVSPIVEAMPGDEKASMMSILHSFYCWGHVATVLVSTAYFLIAGIESWRFLPLIWSIIPIVTAFLFTKVPINTFAENQEKIPFLKIFSMKLFWVFVVIMLCSGAAEQVIAQWVSLFAEVGLGVSKTLGDLLGTCFFAVCMGVTRALYGKFSTRLNVRTGLILSSLICIAGYLVASLPSNAIINLIGCGLCGVGVAIMWPGTLSIAAASCPAGGTAIFALLALAGDAGCFVGPETVSLVSEHFSVSGSGMKAGIVASVIFPILIILCLKLFSRDMKNPK